MNVTMNPQNFRVPAARLLGTLLVMAVLVCAPLYGAGEKTFLIGGRASWNKIEHRRGVTEISSIRPYPVLILSSSVHTDTEALDMDLAFDEGDPRRFMDRTGHYQVKTAEGLYPADRRFARMGMGAALFSENRLKNDPGESPLVLTPKRGALFSPGQVIRDFTLQFWLFPTNLENGEQILTWLAAKEDPPGTSEVQRIRCVASKNRLQWNFLNFFYLNAQDQRITISLEGSKPLIPKTWSHHLIRFDADTGLLEYLVNGQLEAITYVTAGGREGGEIYYPRIGEEGAFSVGQSFIGMLDELKLYGRFVTNPVIYKYPMAGGRVESEPIDLGEINSRVFMVEASGGRTSNTGGMIRNERVGHEGFRFSDDSTLQFFIRAADSPYSWTQAAVEEEGENSLDWQLLIPGASLSGIQGRFVQIAVVFYPSGDGESSPYLDEIRIHYRPDEPPPPPTRLTGFAGDGAVELSWRSSNAADVAGYLVYYGTSQGEYFGEGALLGASPINVGNRTSLRIEGLKNGTLYYFAVAAYDHLEAAHIGAFSREITLRPLRMLE